MFQLYTMTGLKDYILDIIFPRRCLGCNLSLPDSVREYVCKACLAAIKIKSSYACAFCNSPVVAGLTCPFCRPVYFLDRLLVTTSYENPLVEKIIKAMKYRFVKTLAEDIAEFMIKYLERKFLPDEGIDRSSILVIPVPLHHFRLNWRGFNQAEIISSKISSRLGLNFQKDILKRNRNQTPQARISDRKSRITNIKGAFKCQRPELLQNKTILLIDDVATTSSTLNDCARALKSVGAKEVIGFVFAKGTPAWDKKLLQP